MIGNVGANGQVSRQMSGILGWTGERMLGWMEGG